MVLYDITDIRDITVASCIHRRRWIDVIMSAEINKIMANSINNTRGGRL